MFQFLRYYGQYQGIRGRVTGMPTWARLILALVSLPGILLVALSILAVLVSILALLLLTVPVYSVLKTLTAPAASAADVETDLDDAAESRGSRRIDVKIIE